MMYVRGWSLLVVSLLFPILAQAAESCDCPKLGCDPCSEQQGLTFYSGKCGMDNERVKSCGRPTCVPLQYPSDKCPVLPQAKEELRRPVLIKDPVESAERDPASQAAAIAVIGKVKVMHGSVSIVHGDGKAVTVKSDDELREGDTLNSTRDSTAVVSFVGGNRLHVHPETSVQVKEFKDPNSDESRKLLLHLVKGKIRNQVEQKYNGRSSYYRVETREAVAGVRGTDFVVEEIEDGKGKSLTRLETIRGRVAFSSLNETQSVEVGRGQGAKFSDGNLSSLYELREDQLKELEVKSRVDLAKNAAAPEGPICEAPKAMFNECLYRRLEDQKCVRQRCNANGKWAEPTEINDPISASACPTTGQAVKECNY